MENTEQLIKLEDVTSPSKLVALAIQDTLAARKAGVKIEMGSWLTYDTKGACLACFAGCVIRQEKLVPDGWIEDRIEFWKRLKYEKIGIYSAYDAAYALNEFRKGEIYRGLRELNNDNWTWFHDNLPKVDVTYFSYLVTQVGFDRFIADMKRVQTTLEQHNL